MTRTRIAVFDGMPRRHRRKKSTRYGAPLFNNPRMQGYGAPLFNNPRMQGYGAPLFNNPRMQGYGAPLFNNPRMQGYGFDPRELPRGMGRKSYVVPALYADGGYGPVDESGRAPKRLKQKGYRVKKSSNSAWQRKFKKVAKACARKSRGRNARKGSYQVCMRKALRKAKRSRK